MDDTDVVQHPSLLPTMRPTSRIEARDTCDTYIMALENLQDPILSSLTFSQSPLKLVTIPTKAK